MKLKLVLTIVVAMSITLLASEGSKYKFVGVKKCGMCHKSAKAGEQLKIWESSKHANAFKTLQTPEADAIAKKLGVEGKAAEAEQCLSCHVSGHGMDAKMFDKKFDMADGVQCETCHGAGEKYKSKKVMEDHAKSVSLGMKDYTAEGSIKAQCVTCHNDKSPTYKEFNFEEKWKKIAHPVPSAKK